MTLIRKEGILFMKRTKKEDILQNFLQKRIEENENLFSKRELELIKDNFNIVKKIYILGINDINDIIDK